MIDYFQRKMSKTKMPPKRGKPKSYKRKTSLSSAIKVAKGRRFQNNLGQFRNIFFHVQLSWKVFTLKVQNRKHLLFSTLRAMKKKTVTRLVDFKAKVIQIVSRQALKNAMYCRLKSYSCTSSSTRILPESRNLWQYPSTTASTGITL